MLSSSRATSRGLTGTCSRRRHSRARVRPQRARLRKLDTSTAPAGFVTQEVKRPHVAFPKEVRNLSRPVVPDEAFVSAQIHLIPSVHDLGASEDFASR